MTSLQTVPHPELPPLPSGVRFADVDAADIARDEGEMRPASAPLDQWTAYLARLLPPVQADPPDQAGAPALLRTEAGMADFLASLGPAPARELVLGLRALDRSGFWGGVQRQLDGLNLDGRGYSAASA